MISKKSRDCGDHVGYMSLRTKGCIEQTKIAVHLEHPPRWLSVGSLFRGVPGLSPGGIPWVLAVAVEYQIML